MIAQFKNKTLMKNSVLHFYKEKSFIISDN